MITFKKIAQFIMINLQILVYFSFHTLRWSFLTLIIGSRETFGSGSLEALRLLKIQVARYKKHDIDVTAFKGLILCSHKGWIDFYIQLELGFNAFFARALLIIFMPGAAICAWLGGCILYFKRGSSKKDKASLEKRGKKFGDIFTDFLENKNPRLGVFPEGHRYCERGILPFRSGTFRIAYERKIPVLLCPTEGGQYILSEKESFLHKANVRLDRLFASDQQAEIRCRTTLSNPGKRLYRGLVLLNPCAVVDPKDFPSAEAFKEECERIFKQGYAEVCEKYDQIIDQTIAKGKGAENKEEVLE